MIQLKDLVVFAMTCILMALFRRTGSINLSKRKLLQRALYFMARKIMPYHKVMLVVVGC